MRDAEAQADEVGTPHDDWDELLGQDVYLWPRTGATRGGVPAEMSEGGWGFQPPE